MLDVDKISNQKLIGEMVGRELTQTCIRRNMQRSGDVVDESQQHFKRDILKMYLLM